MREEDKEIIDYYERNKWTDRKIGIQDFPERKEENIGTNKDSLEHKVVLYNKGWVIKPSAKFHFRILKSKLLLLPLESTSHPQIFALFIISPLSNFCRVQMYGSFLVLIRFKLNIQIHTFY